MITIPADGSFLRALRMGGTGLAMGSISRLPFTTFTSYRWPATTTTRLGDSGAGAGAAFTGVRGGEATCGWIRSSDERKAREGLFLVKESVFC